MAGRPERQEGCKQAADIEAGAQQSQSPRMAEPLRESAGREHVAQVLAVYPVILRCREAVVQLALGRGAAIHLNGRRTRRQCGGKAGESLRLLPLEDGGDGARDHRVAGVVLTAFGHQHLEARAAARIVVAGRIEAEMAAQHLVCPRAAALDVCEPDRPPCEGRHNDEDMAMVARCVRCRKASHGTRSDDRPRAEKATLIVASHPSRANSAPAGSETVVCMYFWRRPRGAGSGRICRSVRR